MRVFVTGATGFIGSAVVKELINAGHEVLGLARSDEGAKSLTAAGAQVQRGNLENLESLRSGAAASDAVIHLGFIHDFSSFAKNCEVDRRAIEALGDALAGSDRLLLVTGGVLLLAQGRAATEKDVPPPVSASYPRASEATAALLASRGIQASVVRLPQVHNRFKHGLVSYLVDIACEKGVSAYVDEGRNRWSAVHVLDAARLYRLAVEKGTGGARYHAIGEEGVPLRDIAEAIGRRLDIPVVSKSREEIAAHFGPLGFFVAADGMASSAITQQQLGWHPTQLPGLIADIEPATTSEAQAVAATTSNDQRRS